MQAPNKATHTHTPQSEGGVCKREGICGESVYVCYLLPKNNSLQILANIPFKCASRTELPEESRIAFANLTSHKLVSLKKSINKITCSIHVCVFVCVCVRVFV